MEKIVVISRRTARKDIKNMLNLRMSEPAKKSGSRAVFLAFLMTGESKWMVTDCSVNNLDLVGCGEKDEILMSEQCDRRSDGTQNKVCIRREKIL